jgi:hypothetical protein
MTLVGITDLVRQTYDNPTNRITSAKLIVYREPVPSTQNSYDKNVDNLWITLFVLYSKLTYICIVKLKNIKNERN